MRPALRYHGGKWILAPWIISHFPEHRIYVGPYAGAASVLLRKPRSYSEVYNDINDEVVNVFRMMRWQPRRLEALLKLTPFSRTEFFNARLAGKSSLEKARRTIIKSFQGFGSDSIKGTSGFRKNANRNGTTPAHDWKNYAEVLPELIERLRGVTIECKDALEVIADHDSPETLFYIDPPYLHETRTNNKRYSFEMDNEAHVKLAEVLKNVSGKVVLSGYESDLYNELYAGWRRETKQTHADGGLDRTEILWLNFEKPNTIF